MKDNSFRGPAWVIGKAERKLAEIKSTTPGSGKYQYKTYIGEGPKYSMRPKYDIDGVTQGKRSSKAHKKTAVPGPGKYNPLDLTSGPKYTIGVRRTLSKAQLKKRKKRHEVPGVGKYNIRKENDLIVPCYVMSKEERKNLNMNYSALNYPAPNKYKYDYNGSSSQAPQWSFSKAERFGKKSDAKKPKSALFRSSSVPGPGAYEHQKFIGWEGPGYSFPKEKFNHADAVDVSLLNKTINYPSPTTYHSSIRYISNSPEISMSKLERKDTTSDKGAKQFPGPGYYHPNKYNSSVMTHFPMWSLYRSERDESKNEQAKKKQRITTPGPGYYNINQGRIPCGPIYSLAQKFKEKKLDNTPGPGQYNSVIVHLPCEPKFSMGKEKRSEDDKKEEENDNKKIKKDKNTVLPGPGAYNVKDQLFTKSVQFTKAKKLSNKISDVPGPGHYKIPTAFDYINDYTRSKGAFNPQFKYV